MAWQEAASCGVPNWERHVPAQIIMNICHYYRSPPELHEFSSNAKFSWEAGVCVLFLAGCCLTHCYPPQSDKDVVVLVRCSQYLIRGELGLESANTIGIGSLMVEKKRNKERKKKRTNMHFYIYSQL